MIDHPDVAQVAAVVGALGAVSVLLPRGRAALFGGLVLLALAEAGLAVALVPSHDLRLLVHSPTRLAAVALAVIGVIALAAGFVRFPATVPVALLLAAPFRVPVGLGSQDAFLLVPLYGVLAAAVLALIVRAGRNEPVAALPGLLAAAISAFVVVDAVSLLWSDDLRAGSIELAFFVFPFAALLAVVARTPFASWLPRALGTALVGVASVLALIGLWQLHTHHLPFARDLEVANTYSTFTRTTSLFKDPSIYGRHLVLALAVVLVAVWLRGVRPVVAVAVVGLLGAALYFSYSQSSLLTLFVVVLAVTLVAADRRSRTVVALACVAFALVGAAVVATSARGHSAQSFTSGRSRLVSVTAKVFVHHPLAGVGVGSQPLASRAEAGKRFHAKNRNASHATPLTIAAELGVLGIAAYLAFLVALVLALAAVWRRNGALALGLGAALLALVVHSLFYSGFFEDPIMWGIAGVAAAFLATRNRPALGERDDVRLVPRRRRRAALAR